MRVNYNYSRMHVLVLKALILLPPIATYSVMFVKKTYKPMSIQGGTNRDTRVKVTMNVYDVINEAHDVIARNVRLREECSERGGRTGRRVREEDVDVVSLRLPAQEAARHLHSRARLAERAPHEDAEPAHERERAGTRHWARELRVEGEAIAQVRGHAESPPDATWTADSCSTGCCRGR